MTVTSRGGCCECSHTGQPTAVCIPACLPLITDVLQLSVSHILHRKHVNMRVLVYAATDLQWLEPAQSYSLNRIVWNLAACPASNNRASPSTCEYPVSPISTRTGAWLHYLEMIILHRSKEDNQHTDSHTTHTHTLQRQYTTYAHLQWAAPFAPDLSFSSLSTKLY